MCVVYSYLIQERKKVINNLYGDKKDKFYYDIDCNTHDFYKVMSIASYWTFTSETASDERAKVLTEQIANLETFRGFVENDNKSCVYNNPEVFTEQYLN